MRDSEQVTDSDFVSGSKNVTLSTNITDSFDVFNSTNVTNSSGRKGLRELEALYSDFFCCVKLIACVVNCVVNSRAPRSRVPVT